jgi:hypothetical protein
MLTPFEAILLGHLVGDYLLQNNWMAQRKQAHLAPCLVHCVIYTISVCSFTSFSPCWLLAVLLSHFPIDRWSLADKWLHLIKGRSLTDYFTSGHNNIPKSEKDTENNYLILRGGFTTLVYVIVDNTFHLLLMVLFQKLLTTAGLY